MLKALPSAVGSLGRALCKGTRYQDQHLAVHSMPVAVSMRSCRESDKRRIIITAEGLRRKRAFASHLADMPEGLEGDSAASGSADGDMASPARQRRRSTRGDITPSQVLWANFCQCLDGQLHLA